MVQQYAKRNSVKQPSEPKRNSKAGFLKRSVGMVNCSLVKNAFRATKQEMGSEQQQQNQPFSRKSIIHKAQEQQLGDINEKAPPRISKRVSIREDLENANPNSYKIFKPELVKKLSGKSFDEDNVFDRKRTLLNPGHCF